MGGSAPRVGPAGSRAQPLTGAFGTRQRRVLQSKRFQKVLRRLGIQNKTTPPHIAKENGKAERFIRALLNEWAYAHAYPNANGRRAHLPEWLHDYNRHRPHSSLGNQAPIPRLGLKVNNVVRLHI